MIKKIWKLYLQIHSYENSNSYCRMVSAKFGGFFNYKWTNTLKLHHTVSITVLVIFVDVSFFYKDAVMSGCHLDLKLDNVTGMYSTYLKIKATRDFIKDNNQVHQLGFQPLPGFPHAMWENYTIAPITVRKYYNDYTQVPKV